VTAAQRMVTVAPQVTIVEKAANLALENAHSHTQQNHRLLRYHQERRQKMDLAVAARVALAWVQPLATAAG